MDAKYHFEVYVKDVAHLVLFYVVYWRLLLHMNKIDVSTYKDIEI